MARLVVVNPDPRIRGGLVRLLNAAGQVTEAFDSAELAEDALKNAELVFAAAGPGGSLIDPSIVAFRQAGVRRVVWTGPLVAMIQGAVDAGVGDDCLELPTRLPALTALLSRHLKREEGDRWAGEGFLRQVDGDGARFPPIRVLFLAHRLRASGILRAGAVEISLRQGKIAEAKGLWDVGRREGLMAAVGAAIAEGQSPDVAMGDVGLAVMRSLVLLDASTLEVSFSVEDVRSPVVLPGSIPRLLAKALKAVRPADLVRSDLSKMPRRQVRLRAPNDAPESAWGLSPVALRMVRAASQAATVQELIDAGGGGDRDAVWEAFDFLLHLGVVQYNDAIGTVRDMPVASDEVFSDIVIEEIDATPADPRAAELLEEARTIENTPPWELFNISDPADVNPGVIVERFREQSREFHPDRFLSEGREVQAAAAACFAALGDARDKFDDETFRNEVRERIIAKREGRVFVSEANQKKARMLYTQGEHATRRKDWSGAVPSLEQAHELDPTLWEAHLHLVLARWKSGGLTADGAVEALESVVPTTGRGRAELSFHRGEALLAAGKEEAAYEAFEKTVGIDVNHVGAQRRLRMRARRSEQGGGGDAAAGGGLRGIFGWGRKKG